MLRTIRDLRRSNIVFRGASAAVAELATHFREMPRDATLLDVGTGFGDVPKAAARAARDHNIILRTIGLDTNDVIARSAATCVSHSVCGNALSLPFATSSVDVAMCSQTLHHFHDAEAAALLRELNRVARIAVVVSDLRRSWIAGGGFWLASFPLGFHSVTRHDGFVSVMRGYTRTELSDLIAAAIGVKPAIKQRLGFRITASWTPTGKRG
ncbi:MAG: methyltransferase domain-containing protein [Gemmatimonadaceae bacterium]